MRDFILSATLILAATGLVQALLLFRNRRSGVKRQYSDERLDTDSPLDPQFSKAVAFVSQAISAQRVALMSAKSDRVVIRVRDSNFGDAVIKLTTADNPVTLHALYSEAATLTFLDAKGCWSVPRLLGVESSPKGFAGLIRNDVRGDSLHDKVRSAVVDALWPRQFDLANVALELGEAVAEVHRCDVVHGDLKPANVIADWRDERSFRLRGRLHLIDLESAQLCNQQLTWGSRSGTWGFIAPEKYVFVGRPMKESDVWSLSAIVWFLFIGRVGLYGSSAGKRVPSHLRAFLRDSLDVDYRRRPADAAAWTAGLREAIDRDRNDEESPIHGLVDWPKNWRPNYDSLLTQTFERAIALAHLKRMGLEPKDLDTLTRDTVQAIRAHANLAILDEFTRYLESDLRLGAFAESIGKSEGALRSAFEAAYDEVSESVRVLSESHTSTRLGLNRT